MRDKKVSKNLLQYIFCFLGNNLNEIDDLNIYCYPENFSFIQDKQFLKNMFLEQDQDQLTIERTKNTLYCISEPKPQVLKGFNVFSASVNQQIHIGLIFENDDNPFDYKDLFKDLLNEYLNCEKITNFTDEMEIENLLITLFIDIRRHGDEVLEKYPKIALSYKTNVIKAFLFGIHNAGKTSLVRRMKTGEYTDDFFTPTKKFNIEYIEDKNDGLLTVWDMPGQRSFRKKWLLGLQDSNIIIFMIDVANSQRFEESKEEFWNILNRYELVGVPLVILANKIDLIPKISEESEENMLSHLKREIFEKFELSAIENRAWKFLFTSVKTNYNIKEFIDYIYQFTD